MFETADIIYDPITEINYHAINFENAFYSVLPEDKYGDSIQDATFEGVLNTNDQLTGFIDPKVYFNHDNND